MITTCIFDLGGVLFTNGTARFIQDLVADFRLDPARVTELIDGDFGSGYRTGKVSSEEFWTTLRAVLALPIGFEEVKDRWLSRYTLIPGTRRIIEDLRKDYRIWYCSDNTVERIAFLESRYRFLELFEGGVTSDEAGVRKPDLKIYEKVLEKAGITGSEAVFIDDKEINLFPAKKLGMQTVRFRSDIQLEEALFDIGVL